MKKNFIKISILLILGISFLLSEEGCIKGDCVNGQGAYTFPDGQKYVGEFRNSLKNGQGTYTFPDGQKYVGEWKNDSPVE